MKGGYVIKHGQLAETLEDFRIRNDLSLRELARLVGCSVNTIQKIRRQESNITPRVVKKIASLLELPYKQFMEKRVVTAERNPSRETEPSRFSAVAVNTRAREEGGFVWNVPFRPNPVFCGREDELPELSRMLGAEEGGGAAQIVLISGLGGVGKTQLAAEYAHRYREAYPGGVLWCAASGDVLAAYASLAPYLGVRPSPQDSLEDCCVRLRQALQRRPGALLLVIDGLKGPQDYDSLHPYLPTTGDCDILLTGRAREMAPCAELHLDGLHDEAARRLFVSAYGREPSGTVSGLAESICRCLGNLPLALETAGSFLKSAPSVSLADFEKSLREEGLLRQRGLHVDRTLPYTRHRASLKNALAVERELLEDPFLRRLLALLVCFDPRGEGIDSRQLCAASLLFREGGEERLWEAVGVFDKHSLLRIEGEGRLVFNPLVCELLRGQLGREELARAQGDYLSGILNWFREQFKEGRRKDAAREDMLSVERAAQRAVEGVVWPLAFEFCISLGDYYSERGKYLQSLQWLEKGEVVLRFKAPGDKARMASALGALGWQWYLLGDYERALSFYQQALPFYEEYWGENSPETALILNNLGALCRILGRYEGVIDYLERALSISKAYYGERHAAVAGVLNNLAGVCMTLGQYREVLSYYEEALAIDKEYWGKRHPAVAARLCNLGAAWNLLGDYGRALRCLEEALAIDKEYYGDFHPEVARNLNNLGAAWGRAGEHAKAVGFHREALEVWRGVYGDSHPRLAVCLNNIGTAWSAMGEVEKARGYFEQALPIFKAAYGERHPQVAASLNNLGEVWRMERDYEQALRCYEAAFSIYKEFYGENHPDAAVCLNNLGTVSHHLKQYDVSGECFRKAYDALNKSLGGDHPYTRIAGSHLSLCVEEVRTSAISALDMVDEAAAITGENPFAPPC